MDSDGFVVDSYCSSVDPNINVVDLSDDFETSVDTELYCIDIAKYSSNVSPYRPMLFIAESGGVDQPFYGSIPPWEEKKSDEFNAFIHECCCIWCPPLRRIFAPSNSMKRSHLINDMENLDLESKEQLLNAIIEKAVKDFKLRNEELIIEGDLIKESMKIKSEFNSFQEKKMKELDSKEKLLNEMSEKAVKRCQVKE